MSSKHPAFATIPHLCYIFNCRGETYGKTPNNSLARKFPLFVRLCKAAEPTSALESSAGVRDRVSRCQDADYVATGRRDCCFGARRSIACYAATAGETWGVLHPPA